MTTLRERIERALKQHTEQVPGYDGRSLSIVGFSKLADRLEAAIAPMVADKPATNIRRITPDCQPVRSLPLTGTTTIKLWLWKDGDHYLAFDTLYPINASGDPAVIGNPVGYAFLHDPDQPTAPKDAPDAPSSSAPGTGLHQSGTWLRLQGLAVHAAQSTVPIVHHDTAQLAKDLGELLYATTHSAPSLRVEAEAAARELLMPMAPSRSVARYMEQETTDDLAHEAAQLEVVTAIILRHLTVPAQPKAETAGELAKSVRALLDRIKLVNKGVAETVELIGLCHAVEDALNTVPIPSANVREAVSDLLRKAQTDSIIPANANNAICLRDRILTALAPFLAAQPKAGEDAAMLDWLLAYITANGTSGLKKLTWSLYDEDGKSINERKTVTEDEVADMRFDRTAIRAAMQSDKGGAK